MKKGLITFILYLFPIFLNAQQSYNMTLLGKLDYDIGVNDVWGYYDSYGNEFAIVGLENGTSFVDVTNPDSLVEKAFIPGPNSTWRDIKTWRNHAYIVHDAITEGEPQGLLIVDLTELLSGNITYSSFIEMSYERFHNIYIDEKGIAYLFGGDADNGGCLFYDLSISPADPVFIGSYNETYLHDGMVRGDTLWGSAVYEGYLFAIDVSDKQNPIILGGISTPNAFTHNSWVSDDGKTVFTTDELQGASIAAVDVSDVLNMEIIDQIKSWSLDENVIPHNTHVDGNLLVTSYYCDGVTVVDASDPYNLQEVAYYDTSDSTGGTFSGAWGAYPWLPSNNILVTDRQEGLHILRLDNLNFSSQHLETFLDLDLYPNPTVNEFHLNLEHISWVSIKVYNVSGKLVDVFINSSNPKSLIIGSDWHPGIYFLELEDLNQFHLSYKIIKH